VGVVEALEENTREEAAPNDGEPAAPANTDDAGQEAPAAQASQDLIVVSGATAVDGPTFAATSAPPSLQQEPEDGSSRILLWGAFLLALLVFSASVVGAILLYSRQRTEN
jgi:hypothetical protein